MRKDTGGPAFPSGLKEEADDTVDSLHKGMTLRDYFAAKAMQGDWAANNAGANGETIEQSAKRYYRMADAMLKARNQ